MAKLQIMDTTIRDGQQSLWATRMQVGDMLPILPDDGPRGLLGHRGLGRRHVRHVPALPRREPVGAPALHQGPDAQHPACPCSPAARTSWATSTTPSEIVQPLHQGRQAQRHPRVPRLRRAQRHPQRRGQRRGHQGMRRALRGRHLLHHVRRCTRSTAFSNTASSSRTSAPTPSPSRTWRACSRPTAPSAWSRRSTRKSACRCTSTATTSAAWPRPTSSRPPRRARPSPTRPHAPLAFGNSHPAVEMIVAALQESRYDTGLDLDLLFEIAEYWEEMRKRGHYKRGVSLAHPHAGVLRTRCPAA